MLREDAMTWGKMAGGELYHGMNRLLSDWHNRDADSKTQTLPQLVTDLTRLADGYDAQVARLAAHDGDEAA